MGRSQKLIYIDICKIRSEDGKLYGDRTGTACGLKEGVPTSLFPITSKRLDFLFLMSDMSLEIFLHITTITKIFLMGSGCGRHSKYNRKWAEADEKFL